ncbi:myosin-10-like [Dreissena polymorpha]|uniref:myosin-10-like n=1 Tax=Dreissena polymorpha TaxID=45954 RepID=UPI002264F220|nr:myosin-10-like [Dreissena polymorpha]
MCSVKMGDLSIMQVTKHITMQQKSREEILETSKENERILTQLYDDVLAQLMEKEKEIRKLTQELEQCFDPDDKKRLQEQLARKKDQISHLWNHKRVMKKRIGTLEEIVKILEHGSTSTDEYTNQSKTEKLEKLIEEEVKLKVESSLIQERLESDERLHYSNVSTMTDFSYRSTSNDDSDEDDQNSKGYKLSQTMVKPLLQVTGQEEKMHVVEIEMNKYKENLDRAKTEMEELERKYAQIIQEKNIPNEQLQAEAEMVEEAREASDRLKVRNDELEDYLHDIRERMEEQEEKVAAMLEERKKYNQTIQDLEDQLEEEESGRQKLQLEKVTVDAKIKKLMEDVAIQDDSNQKLTKEKRSLEERLAEVSSSLVKEEEKAKQLGKLKTKYEAIIADLEDRLRKEQQARQELEKIRRRLESEIADLKEPLNEKRLQVEDLQSQLARREEEIQGSLQRVDEESVAKFTVQKQLREMQNQLQEVLEDLETERDTRIKAERQKKDLNEELEALKTELEDSLDTTAAFQDLRVKREDELKDLNGTIEKNQKTHEAQVAEMRTKHTQQMEQYNEELENVRKAKAQLEKTKTTLEAENTDLANDLKQVQMAKQESERKRKQAEQTLAELNIKLAEIDRVKAEQTEKASKATTELETLTSQLEAADTKNIQLGQKVSTLEAQLADSQELVEEETRGKLAAQSKLRQEADEKEALKERLDEEEETRHALEKQIQDLQQKKSTPGKPSASEVGSDTITLTWDKPALFKKGDHFQISCRENKESRWKICHESIEINRFELTNVKSKSQFIFRIRAVYNDYESDYSKESDIVTTKESPASQLIRFSTPLSAPDVLPIQYALPMIEVEGARNKIGKTRKFEIGSPRKGYWEEKTILLIGETETGKSTLLDGMANFILGVNWNDEFRFSIANLEDKKGINLFIRQFRKRNG